MVKIGDAVRFLNTNSPGFEYGRVIDILKEKITVAFFRENVILQKQLSLYFICGNLVNEKVSTPSIEDLKIIAIGILDAEVTHASDFNVVAQNPDQIHCKCYYLKKF